MADNVVAGVDSECDKSPRHPSAVTHVFGLASKQ